MVGGGGRLSVPFFDFPIESFNLSISFEGAYQNELSRRAMLFRRPFTMVPSSVLGLFGGELQADEFSGELPCLLFFAEFRFARLIVLGSFLSGSPFACS